MYPWKRQPLNAFVAKYVECYWFLEKESDDIGYDYPKLNPDPAAHLIIAASKQRYQYSESAVSYKGSGSHWILPHCKTFVMDHSEPFQIFGIKFRVGALYALNASFPSTDLDTILNVDLNDLFNTQLFSPLDLLVNSSVEHDEVCATMDEALLTLVLDDHEDKHSQLVNLALPLLADSPASQIGTALHCAQRTIERSFLRVTKFSLKQFQAMTRLEAMLEYTSQLDDSQLNWADIAIKFGFSDQPH